MSLDAYRRKRDFSKTSEPVTHEVDSTDGRRFVIQKHDSRNLHYDLRLEYQGVLKSWAIPKGPSLDPIDKRLAIQAEDHPLEYLSFEGSIPKDQYGGGTMLVWDTGTWQPLQEDGFESGDLKFALNGEKLTGGWMLVHTGRRRGNHRHWLLFKERDTEVRLNSQYDILTDLPNSVISGRSMEQVADKARSRVTSQATATKSRVVEESLPRVENSQRKKMPEPGLNPCLPTITRVAPSGGDWIHEIKFDGYRMLCHAENQKVRFLSRNGNDWTGKLAHLADAVAQLNFESAILDGEIVAMTADGRTDFQLLQSTISTHRSHELRFYLFDLLYLNGYDLRASALIDRKSLLRECIPAQHTSILYSDHLTGEGPTVFQQACRLGAEGIVSKRSTRRYIEGRTADWLKTKCLESTEFIVGGFTDSKSQRRGLGALVVGRYDGPQLVYEGRVGTGFSANMLSSLFEKIVSIEQKTSPFSNLTRHDVGPEFHWVAPG